MGEQAYWFFVPLFSISGIKFPISDASERMYKSIFPMDFEEKNRKKITETTHEKRG